MSKTVEQPSQTDLALDDMVGSILTYTKCVVADSVPDFLDWFVKAGGNIELPRGRDIPSLVEQFIMESEQDPSNPFDE